jgi:hypothetical protein
LQESHDCAREVVREGNLQQQPHAQSKAAPFGISVREEEFLPGASESATSDSQICSEIAARADTASRQLISRDFKNKPIR